MRKIMGALLLAVVFFGLMPFVAAAESAEPVRYRAQDNGSEDSAQIRPVLISAGGNMTLLRERIQERIELAQERYATAKQRYMAAKQAHISARERLNQTKEAYNSCKGNQTEECDQVRAQVKTNSKQFLMNSGDRVVAMLEKIRERVASCEYLSDEEVEERVAEIDAKIAEIEDAQETVESLGNESTAAEMRNAVNAINQAWKRSQTVMKNQVGRLMNDKIGGIAVKSENLAERLQNAIGTLEEQGEDTAELEQLMEQFRNRIQNAEEHQELAREKYQESNSGEVDEAMQEANRHMQEAHNELQEAHTLLVQIMRQIRATKRGQQALAEAEAEQEE
ncbi:hypothetical protein JW707_04305 [Candidatus Woesearchaeota archaeon]|nr:hypothetical protein [Candidatus Woesearchaeota archaeon]